MRRCRHLTNDVGQPRNAPLELLPGQHEPPRFRELLRTGIRVADELLGGFKAVNLIEAIADKNQPARALRPSPSIIGQIRPLET